jgi:F-type H+-transporting ATPase subunit a
MTTLGLAITAFLYTQISAIQMHGLLHYLQGYLKPFFVMAPLHVISHLSSIISISFRLFGNIFGGAVITGLWGAASTAHWLLVIPSIPISLIIMSFFLFFEGFIQAFVFTMLSLTYLSLEVKTEAIESHEQEC